MFYVHEMSVHSFLLIALIVLMQESILLKYTKNNGIHPNN